MRSDDEEDWSELAEAWKRNSRGANDYWYWKDRPVMEAGIAREVLSSAGLAVEWVRSREPGQDPPDCEAVVDGAFCGIELTELVHEPTLKASIKASRTGGVGKYFIWSEADLREALQQSIDRKDVARKVKGGPYDRYILVLHTDEFCLGRHDVGRYLTGATFRSDFITEAYLGLSYDPECRSYPVFPLALTARSGASA